MRALRLFRGGANWRFWAAIAFGVAVWIGVTLEQNPRVTNFAVSNIPVDLVGLGPNLITTLDPLPVDVVLQGLRDDLDQVTVRNFTARLNMNGLGPGNHLIAVELIAAAADSVEVVDIRPASVPISLTAVVTQTRTVELVIDNPPAAGFSIDLDQIKIEPPLTQITGPEPAVAAVDRVEVQLSAIGIDQAQVVQLVPRALDVQGREISNLEFEPNLYAVSAPVSQSMIIKSVPVTIATLGSPLPGFAVVATEVAPATTEISGLPDAVAQIESVFTEAVIIRGQRQTAVTEAGLVAPEGVQLVNPTQRFRVTVDVDPIVSAVALADVIELDLPSQYLAQISPPVANLVLEGLSVAVFGLTPRDISTRVDLGAAPSEGVYILTPMVSAPTRVEVLSVEPSVVTVTVTTKPTPTPQPSPAAEPEVEDAATEPSGSEAPTGQTAV